jgi:hypothetical protein
MLTIHIRHNGNGFLAHYLHHARRVAAFATRRDEFERLLGRFIRLCRRFGINLRIIRYPSFFCGLAAEGGDELAAAMLAAAKIRDPFADDADQQWEACFPLWPTYRE